MESFGTGPSTAAIVVPSAEAGGVGTVCLDAARALAEATGWEVDYIALHDAPFEATDELDSRVKLLGLGIAASDYQGMANWISHLDYTFLLNSGLPTTLYSLIPARTRHVVHIHDGAWQFRRIVSEGSDFIDGVICVAQFIEDRLRRESIIAAPTDWIRTIHNGANFPPPPLRPYLAGPLRLLYLGSMDPLKGLDDVPGILSGLRKQQVPFVMSIAGGHDRVIHRQLERRGLASCVRWLGRVPHAECFRLASEHDLLFVPSRREAFGMVTVEAMSMGCVPIAYSVPAGSREIIEHGVSGFLISPYRRDCWIEQVVKLNNDRGTLELVSRNCTERARTHFNANRMGEQLRDFLRQVASRPIVPTRGAAYCSPLNTAAPSRRKASSYHRLPEPMRKWIRRFVARHPSWFAKLIHR